MIKFVFAGAALVATGAGLALAQPAPLSADKSVSVSDLRQRSAERFTALDTNKDGQLSQQELQAGGPRMGRRGGPREHFGMGPGGPGRPGMRRGGPGGPGGPGPLFQDADANNDGVVTQQEFTAEALKHFQQLDTNRDGRVAGDEAQAARARFGERFGRRGGNRFARLDADHNGAVSRAEFDRQLSERIGRLDANRDGKITVDERRAGRARPGEPR